MKNLPNRKNSKECTTKDVKANGSRIKNINILEYQEP